VLNFKTCFSQNQLFWYLLKDNSAKNHQDWTKFSGNVHLYSTFHLNDLDFVNSIKKKNYLYFKLKK